MNLHSHPRTVLIITSSGGGGLLQAALAKEQEEKAKDPFVRIIKRDLMKEWYFKRVGHWGIRQWDQAQRKGHVAVLKSAVYLQPISDFIFWPRIFLIALKTFFKEDVDHIIDTQPTFTSAILCALRVFNRLRNKQVMIEKVAVDLPTKLNTHFFRPLKSLSDRDRQIFRLVTLPPLLEESQTAEEFWRKQCKLSEGEVKYEYYPIRQSFRKYWGVPKSRSAMVLVSHISNVEEKELMSRAIARGPLRAELTENRAKFFLDPQDRVVTLLLGSQPAFEATLNYIKTWIALAKEPSAGMAPIHLFVLCAHHKIGENSLLRHVSDLICQTKEISSQLTVIPMTFQNEEVIASLFWRSDATCTRSGGQTAMELMCVRPGEIWIHSELKRPISSSEENVLSRLLKGIPGWEAGNARYLHQLHGAKIVTPTTCIPHGREVLKIRY